MRTREELCRWVRQRISDAERNAPHLVGDGGRAFMVHGTIGEVSYLTTEGLAVLEIDTLDPTPGTLRRETGPHACRHVFFYGARNHPELRDWIPARRPDDSDCPSCNGTGWQSVGQHRVGCTECAGFGWLVDIAVVDPNA